MGVSLVRSTIGLEARLIVGLLFGSGVGEMMVNHLAGLLGHQRWTTLRHFRMAPLSHHLASGLISIST